jgi:protein required for attachment to host cells
MMAENVPHKALVVVTDGAGARFFRNAGNAVNIELSAEGDFKPSNLLDDGPSGVRPSEQSPRETDEATFAKQLAKELYRRAHSGDFTALALISDPQTLGQIRPLLHPLLHKEVQERLTAEVGKMLTKASILVIQKALHT